MQTYQGLGAKHPAGKSLDECFHGLQAHRFWQGKLTPRKSVRKGVHMIRVHMIRVHMIRVHMIPVGLR